MSALMARGDSFLRLAWLNREWGRFLLGWLALTAIVAVGTLFSVMFVGGLFNAIATASTMMNAGADLATAVMSALSDAKAMSSLLGSAVGFAKAFSAICFLLTPIAMFLKEQMGDFAD